jgi:hypothetical protein
MILTGASSSLEKLIAEGPSKYSSNLISKLSAALLAKVFLYTL